MTKTVNRLSRRECRQLEDLIAAQADLIDRGVLDANTLAFNATKHLGRPILVTNVASAAAAVGVKFPNKAAGGVHALRNLKQLRGAVTLLARELSKLRAEYGETVSPELNALATIGGEEVVDGEQS